MRLKPGKGIHHEKSELLLEHCLKMDHVSPWECERAIRYALARRTARLRNIDVLDVYCHRIS